MRLASGDREIVSTLRTLTAQNGGESGDIGAHLNAAWRIRDNMSLAPSIDNFLDTHRDDTALVEFGKIAICHAIQTAEFQSRLFVGNRGDGNPIDFRSISGTWLEQLFKLLVAQRSFSDFLIALEQITFVSFNYDRCIHQFFYLAGTSYFNLNSEGQSKLLSTLRVIYPYGAIGDFGVSGSSTNFGKITYYEQLIGAARQIRTFTEGAESDRVERIRDEIAASEIVMFLGFGYLPLNMELLFKQQRFKPIRVLGTGKGLSKDSISEVELELGDIFIHKSNDLGDLDDPNRIKIVDCTCGELFFEFQRYLTRAR